MKRLSALLVLASLAFAAAPARADEGMWTFDAFPSAKVKAAYGFAPSQAWLDHVRRSVARIPGCSSSFVSPQGLLLTNHHCALGCVAALSSKEHNYAEAGFYAEKLEDEVACPNFEALRLDSISDVTAAMDAATKGKTGSARVDASRAKQRELTTACSKPPAVRCDLVVLYHGAVSKLYKYDRSTDVRLVFAPEERIAQFGGDPDNFNFPRYDLDMSLLRAYKDGKPLETTDYLKWNPQGTKDGDLVFVAGHPGSTQRELTVSQLTYLRDVSFPRVIPALAEWRGILEEYQMIGPEERRTTDQTLFFLDNAYKVQVGHEQALLEPDFFGQKVAEERALRVAIAKRPEMQKRYGRAWDDLAAVQRKKAELALTQQYVAGGPQGALWGAARGLVRIANPLPNAPEAAGQGADAARRRLLSPVPIQPGREELQMAFWAKRLREDLGADDPFVKKVLGSQSPQEWAHVLVTTTKLSDLNYRRSLLDGGKAAIDASDDPLVKAVASIDADARAAQRRYEDEVAGPEGKAAQDVARARFAVYGTSTYPDATFTLRLSYGAVKGFTSARGPVASYTKVGGLYDRATGRDPFRLPKRLIDAKGSLDPNVPMNLSSTNDITGGNSGSPLIDKDGRVVGLAFDGNIYSLGGEYGFDPVRNRTVSVDSRAMGLALTSVYKAQRIAVELGL
ncbi:MAG: S46 family peptidase [Candidatus Eremiobacteraeota bacterium]|nr:S46 family peptidase [Candidatus Eremiobacteraeota bacterium]